MADFDDDTENVVLVMDKLFQAIEDSDIDVVRQLTTDLGVNRIHPGTGYAAIHHAAMGGHIDALKAIIASGGNPKLNDKYQATALHWAAYHGKVSILQYLIKTCGVEKLDVGDMYGNAAIHSATMQSHREAVEYLLDAGASVQASNIFGMSPLHTAAEWGCITVAEVLLERGADIYAKNEQGKTAYDVTSSEAFRLLIDQKRELQKTEAKQVVNASVGALPASSESSGSPVSPVVVAVVAGTVGAALALLLSRAKNPMA